MNKPKFDYEFVFTMLFLCVCISCLGSSALIMMNSSSSSEPSKTQKALGPGKTSTNLALLAT